MERLNSTGVSHHNTTAASRMARAAAADNPKRPSNLSNVLLVSGDSGVREMLQSLGLLCIVSLLLALLSLGKYITQSINPQ